MRDYAVVAGMDLNGLGVLRALGKAGIPVMGLDTDLKRSTAATRFGAKRQVRALSGPQFIDDLLALRQRFASNPVLLLTQEASVATVSAARGRLSGAYRFTLPPHDLMEQLLDKLHFQALAEQHGFAIPRAVRVGGPDAAGAVRDLRFPCVLKPMTKHAGYAKRFAKAYRVASAEEVDRLWSDMREVVDEIIVQEWIEGGDSDVYFCLQYRQENGRSVSFVGRKLCQWPMLVGGTASCVPAPEAAKDLTALTDGFFMAVGFVGVGSMEFKRDVRDGRFYMVEPTVGRTDYQEEIACLNGVNIPLAAYWSELGLSAPPPDPPGRARAWVDPMGYARARDAGAPDLMAKFASGMKICDAYFRADDPMPYVAMKLQPLLRRVSRFAQSRTS